MQATCCTLPSREEQTPKSHVARNVRPSQKGKTKNHPKAEDPKIKPRKKRVGEGGTHPAEQENWEEESQNSIQAKLVYFAGSDFRHSKRPNSKKEKQQPPSLPHPAASPILLLIKPNQKSIVEEEQPNSQGEEISQRRRTTQLQRPTNFCRRKIFFWPRFLLQAAPNFSPTGFWR